MNDETQGMNHHKLCLTDNVNMTHEHDMGWVQGELYVLWEWLRHWCIVANEKCVFTWQGTKQGITHDVMASNVVSSLNWHNVV